MIYRLNTAEIAIACREYIAREWHTLHAQKHDLVKTIVIHDDCELDDDDEKLIVEVHTAPKP